MNTLWIFGDSFSWDHKIRFKTMPQIKNDNDQVWLYIKEHLNGEIFDSWGEILSRNLNLNYKNPKPRYYPRYQKYELLYTR